MKTEFRIFEPPLKVEKTEDYRYKGFEYRSLVDGYGCVFRIETVRSGLQACKSVLFHVQNYLN